MIIEERQTILPTAFECIACGLKILGYSKLYACGLGNTYTSMSRYDIAIHFGQGGDEWHGMEEDNNEP